MERDQQISISFIIHSNSESRRQLIKCLLAELIELELKGEILAEETRNEVLENSDSEFLPVAKSLELEMNKVRVNEVKSILDRLSGEK